MCMFPRQKLNLLQFSSHPDVDGFRISNSDFTNLEKAVYCYFLQLFLVCEKLKSDVFLQKSTARNLFEPRIFGQTGFESIFISHP